MEPLWVVLSIDFIDEVIPEKLKSNHFMHISTSCTLLQQSSYARRASRRRRVGAISLVELLSIPSKEEDDEVDDVVAVEGGVVVAGVVVVLGGVVVGAEVIVVKVVSRFSVVVDSRVVVEMGVSVLRSWISSSKSRILLLNAKFIDMTAMMKQSKAKSRKAITIKRCFSPLDL